MRVLYIVGIVFAFFFLIIMAAGTVGTAEEKRRYRSDYEYYDYDYTTPQYVESTYIATGISFVYFVFAYVLYILSLIFVKTTAARIFAIIGLALTLIMTVWGIIVAGNARSISFDEVGGAWILYALITLAISIIGTVQSFRYHNQQRAQRQQPGWPPYNQPYPPYPPQQPYGQGYPPYNQPPYPPQQQPPYPPQQPPYPPQQGQPPYPPPPPGWNR
ncbi:MAG: hypothetical protein MUC87_09200 [Bacteroidia bacterium]|jgi:hypothetical protein|nr:hypothetical protein [Bacteroidia bacterium]